MAFGTRTIEKKNVTACTFSEGKLFVAWNDSIDEWNVDTKTLELGVLRANSHVDDINYHEGRLFAVGTKLTVWDLRRKIPPGRIDQLWDKFLRLF